ncbi:hypothetical protein GCM10007358_10050 [Phocicoccus schoeneichii]|nr:hypothetical protein GCM10007358_10050 [Jeotgalicoccus schoeneichii]
MDFGALAGPVSDVVELEVCFKIRIDPFNGCAAFENCFPCFGTPGRCGVSSEIFGDFNLPDLLTDACIQ